MTGGGNATPSAEYLISLPGKQRRKSPFPALGLNERARWLFDVRSRYLGRHLLLGCTDHYGVHTPRPR